LEVKTTVVLERKEIEEALSDYLAAKGYKTEKMNFLKNIMTNKVYAVEVEVSKN
jgi:CRISPR/Cas system Type II protein with McrA/HNH and RuvC-like nuclease domain